MFPFYRMAEIVIYSLINFLPFMILAMLPFRDSLRFSKPVTVFLGAVLTLLQVGCGFVAVLFPAGEKGILSVISTSVYFLFYFASVRAYFGKTLFTLLMFSNIANLTVVLSKCIEGRLFPHMAIQAYRWSFSAIMLVTEIVILTPLYFYIRRYFAGMMKKEGTLFAWRYLWVIPATFYLLWSYQLYSGTESALESALQPANAAFLLCISLGAFLIYHIVVCLIEEYDKNLALKVRNDQLLLQKLQYDNLKDKITEARQAKHDLHHHIAVMTGYLSDGKFEELEKYLASYRNSLPDESAIVLCQNYEINLLLLYFSQQAKENQIAFFVYVDIPEKLNIDEIDISVLLGNLLENAMDACIAEKDTSKKIIVRGQKKNNTLFLTIDNTFHGKVKKDKNGIYFSAKHDGQGIGVESARQIVLRYHGVFQSACEDEMFCVSVILPLNRN